MDSEGALFIVGRTKELIIRSGFNVYPVEVEAVLNAHPDITQSAVVGRTVAGATRRSWPTCSCCPGSRHDHRGSDGTTPRRQLTAYKRPSEIVVLDALPASSTGKILEAPPCGELPTAAPQRPTSAHGQESK